MSLEIPSTSVDNSHDDLSFAEERAFEFLTAQYDKAAIKMDDFIGIEGYGEKRVDRDKYRIAKKKQLIKEMGKPITKKAKLLEALLTEQIELSNWFGQETSTIVPSEFDDLFHGVDLALEIDDEKEVKHLALGIDVTSSPYAIRNKLKIIKRQIENEKLTAMEYFHSEEHNPDFYGTMSNIPQVVIGIDGKTIKELSELWFTANGRIKLKNKYNQPNLSHETEENQRKRSKEAFKNLAEHRAQILLLEQIKIQLIAFYKFALEKSKIDIAKKFLSTLELVNSVIKSKTTPDVDVILKNDEDRVFQSLKESLYDFGDL